MKKGAFITIYGINNIGKSTQSRILSKKLLEMGYDVEYTKYPCYDIEPTGVFLNKVLRSKEGQKISEDELQMWFVLNRYQFQPTLQRYLDEGKIVIAEDYVWTGVAWGMAKGMEKEWLTGLNKFLIQEDFSILMEGTRDTRAKEKHHVHEQNDELIKKCTNIFSHLADEKDWKRVKVQKKISDTADLLFEAVDGFLRNR